MPDCCELDNKELDLEKKKELKQIFIVVLVINFVMFVTEFIGGIISSSNALLADSLDMLGDALVYGISLFVINRPSNIRAKASLIKGFLMLLLGSFVVYKSILKIITPTIPQAETITLLGIFALVANLVSFLLLMKRRKEDINIRSAWICSRNDVIANIAVIGAGTLVSFFNSAWPDILVGLGISVLIIQSSVQVIIEGYKHSFVKKEVKNTDKVITL
ncbi:MAG: cation diffusion facilitator family transporter [bacterium]|nr:cation diffusion facilitator family transporter [bacterium]